MKKVLYPILVWLIVILLSACAGTAPGKGSGMINPGDRIGDFLVTTRGEEDVIYMTNLHCPFTDTTETCERFVGERVNVSQGFMPAVGKTPFEQAWSEQTCEITIDGRPLNLQAFGFDEWKHIVAGTIRVWNVVIVADKPGTISVESKGVFDGEAWNYIAEINFVAK